MMALPNTGRLMLVLRLSLIKPGIKALSDDIVVEALLSEVWYVM